MPANPNPSHVSEGNHFLWASANVRRSVLGGRHLHSKPGSCHGVSSFTSTWSRTRESQQSRAPLPPSLLWKARQQHCDIEEVRTSVCPCEGKARGHAARTAAHPAGWAPPCFVTANAVLTTCVPSLFKELGRRATDDSNGFICNFTGQSPEKLQFHKKKSPFQKQSAGETHGAPVSANRSSCRRSEAPWCLVPA